MTSNKYVVLNCPTLMGNRLCYSKEIKQCADCTDCVIKQVIELCKHYKKHSDCGRDCPSFGSFLNKLLNKFDIEEINKWQKK